MDTLACYLMILKRHEGDLLDYSSSQSPSSMDIPTFNVSDLSAALSGIETHGPPSPFSAEDLEVAAQLLSYQSMRGNIETIALQARSLMPERLFAARSEEETARRILTWFKAEFMRPFVSTILCSSCQGPTKSVGSAQPSAQERLDGAGVVEIHVCSLCEMQNRFPRYNGAKILETRLGRCGEWAQTFVSFLRAAKLEARLVFDLTEDHLWAEAKISGVWTHLDPCEASYNQPLLYEEGWGKKLSYIFAFDRNYCADVWKRYSIKRSEVLSRRTLISEAKLLRVLLPMQLVPASTRRELNREQEELERALEAANTKVSNAESLPGRVTGSNEWRKARGETGKAILFDGGTPNKIKERLLIHARELNCKSDETTQLNQLFEALEANSVSPGDFSFLIHLLETWPREKVFPVLDLTRLCLIRPFSLPQDCHLTLIKFAICVQDDKFGNINRFLSLQALSNLIATRSLKETECQAMVSQLKNNPAIIDERSRSALDVLLKNVEMLE